MKPLAEISVVMFAAETHSGLAQPAWGMSSRVHVEPAAVALVARTTAETHSLLPIKKQGRVLLVAFANLTDQAALQAVTQETGLRIRPVQASAEEIRRTLPIVYGAAPITEFTSDGSTHLGWLLIERGLLELSELEEALSLQARLQEKLGTILVNMGVINRLVLAEVLAEQFQIPFVNLRQDQPQPDVVRLLDPTIARRLSAVPVRWSGNALLVALADPTSEETRDALRAALNIPLLFAVASEPDIHWVLDHVYRVHHIEESIMGLLYRNPDESAYETFTDIQLILLLTLVTAILVAFIAAPSLTLVVINAGLSAFYFVISLYRLWIAYRGANVNRTIDVSPPELAEMDEASLPTYTILIPLYKEKEVLPEIVRSIELLDYPKTKLDVKLLLEERDPETIAAAIALRPPAHFEFLRVPDAEPHTKPKACNYGLVSARGTYTVIYDAEDRPDPHQLKLAVAAFRKAPRDVICLQAKLNYYNQAQNLLTRWFTLEYSSWFDLLLPGLDNTGAPIPLGGTSNHFYTEKLRELGAWDPFNVTEDADLGIRMAKYGYRTAIIDSTTYEEANSDVGNWIRQRSRWVKGYMQTWLVHMRHPWRMLRTLGWGEFVSFHFTIGGTPLVFLLNPLYWALTLLWALTHWGAIQLAFPSSVYYVAMFNLLVGNFVFVYLNLVGAYRREYYALTRYALFSPLYWVLMSIASWKALWQLFTNPFYWEKTVHGLHQAAPSPKSAEETP